VRSAEPVMGSSRRGGESGLGAVAGVGRAGCSRRRRLARGRPVRRRRCEPKTEERNEEVSALAKRAHRAAASRAETKRRKFSFLGGLVLRALKSVRARL
jgi:hypothetical protein